MNAHSSSVCLVHVHNLLLTVVVTFEEDISYRIKNIIHNRMKYTDIVIYLLLIALLFSFSQNQLFFLQLCHDAQHGAGK